MGLSGALAIASSGLANINLQLDIVSQNVANANSPGYASEVLPQQSMDVASIPMGVRTGVATRLTDTVAQNTLYAENASVSSYSFRQTTLQAIDAVQGTPGSGADIASQLGALQNGFSALLSNPASAAAQSAVVQQAGTLAQSINRLSGTLATQRQNAENTVVNDVTTLNAALVQIGTLSDQIVAAKSLGTSTAALEDQRAAAMQQVSGLVSARFVTQPNGDMQVFTPSGLTLPTHGQGPALSTAAVNVAPGNYYPGGGIPAITLGGVDITAQLQGGEIGQAITLRDQTLPTYQAGLDEFSQNLASRFQTQGLTLFSDPSGNVPAAGVPVQQNYVGFASVIGVNPVVAANPALVRDGTLTGAAALNPNGLAGFTGLISNVVDYALGTNAAPGVPQPASNTTGLGPGGNLSLGYPAPATLGDFASTLLGTEETDSASTSSALTTAQAAQATYQGQLSAATGVNIDQQLATMVALQNSYAANAKVVSAVQTMWNQLLSAVP